VRSFSFLEGLGFACTNNELDHLRYETDKVFVAITWDRRSGELNEFVGLRPHRGEQEVGISLSDLLAMEGVNLPPFQVADEGRLAPFVEKLAEETKNFARPALAGDRMYFRRLRTFRNAAGRRYLQELTLKKVRSEVTDAWRKRDYRTVVELYASIENDLTDSEKGKLSYARRQTAEDRPPP
jgi:hypothetical protein